MPKWNSHLGYKKNDNAEDHSGNSRNGYTSKKVILENNGTIVVQVPRDCNSSFESVIIPKHEKRPPPAFQQPDYFDVFIRHEHPRYSAPSPAGLRS